MKVYVRDFTRTPGPRFKRLGRHSAEEFREILLKALATADVVEVVLDGTRGYGSSFLEELFGGLVRSGAFTAEDLRRRVKILAETPAFVTYEREAQSYFDQALNRMKL